MHNVAGVQNVYLVFDLMLTNKHWSHAHAFRQEDNKRFWRSGDRASWYILVLKPTRCTNSQFLFFGIKLYKFRTIPLSIIRTFSLYTQHWYMSYRFAGSLRSVLILLVSCQQTCITWHIPSLCVQWKTPDDGQRNCPKHVDARSPERQILPWFV